jgi:hypothetical protein
MGGPERTLTARQELHLIRDLFADDQPVLQIIDGLAEMDLSMKEAAAFAGITFPARPQAADFFDVDQLRRLGTGDAKISKDPQEE